MFPSPSRFLLSRHLLPHYTCVFPLPFLLHVPLPFPIPAILSSLPLSPTSQKCNNAFGATVGGRNVASILSVFGPEVQSLPPPFPPSLILKLRGVLKDKRGEMTKCCITPVCTNIKAGGKGGATGRMLPNPHPAGTN